MAKLYGTADPTLVSAAFKHGESMVGFDMKDIYEQRTENVKAFTTAVSDMFNSIYADNKNTMDLLTDNAQKALEIMENGDFINEGGLEFHNDVVNGYKARLKEINAEYGTGKGGDLERSKLRAEMNRYLSVLESSDQMFQNMTKNAANSRLLNDLGDDKVHLFNMILEDHNNGTSIVQKEYKDGDILYGIPGSDVRISMSEINKGMSAYDPEYLSGINSLLTKFKAKGQAMGGTMSADDALRFKNEIQSSITSWDEIRNVSQAKLGNMKFSFEEVLTGQAVDSDGNIDADLISRIYDELEKLGGADLDNDNDIDETDKSLLAQAKANGEVYVDPKNGFTLIDALKKDKQKYRDVMANYLTETAVKDFYGQGAALRKSNTPTGNAGKKGYAPFASNTAGEGYLGAKHPIKKSTLNSYWDQLNSKKIGDYELKDGSWTDGEQTFSGDDMMKAIANELAGMVPEGQYYTRDADFWLKELKNNASFKPFFGSKKEYKMPKNQENQIDKLWNNAKEGLTGSTEAYAVSTLNSMFGGGFTQEDPLNKWTIGYGTGTYNLKVPGDKDLLIEAIKIQQAIDAAK